MVLTVRVKEGHATSNVFGKREPKVPVERDLFILQHVIQTSFRAILSNDGHVRWNIIQCDSYELAQVRMVQVSNHRETQMCHNYTDIMV